jgi:anionic cell wall polymer biosynthesis LytR-Cps2A-Psr (LCP) family protein
MTDAVGGVSVCLASAIKDDYSGLNLPAGTSVISGGTALAFLRTRHGVGDGSDLSRISNQQVYLSSLIRRIKSDDTLTDFTKLYALANVAATNVRLSTSLTSLDTMVSMAQSLRTINLDTMALVQYPGTTGDSRYPGKVVPLTDTADALFAAIAADQPLSLATDALGSGSTLDPSVVTDTPTDGTTAVPTDTATTGVEITGLLGQTAETQTCSVAFGD